MSRASAVSSRAWRARTAEMPAACARAITSAAGRSASSAEIPAARASSPESIWPGAGASPAVGGLVEPVERPGPGEVPAASRVGAARGGPGQELGLEQTGGGAQRDPDVLSPSEAGTGQQ